MKGNQQSDHECLRKSLNTLKNDFLAVSANRILRPARYIRRNYMGNVYSKWDSYAGKMLCLSNPFYSVFLFLKVLYEHYSCLWLLDKVIGFS